MRCLCSTRPQTLALLLPCCYNRSMPVAMMISITGTIEDSHLRVQFPFPHQPKDEKEKICESTNCEPPLVVFFSLFVNSPLLCLFAFASIFHISAFSHPTLRNNLTLFRGSEGLLQLLHSTSRDKLLKRNSAPASWSWSVVSLYDFRSNEKLQTKQEISLLMGNSPLGCSPHTYTQGNNTESKEGADTSNSFSRGKILEGMQQTEESANKQINK